MRQSVDVIDEDMGERSILENSKEFDVVVELGHRGTFTIEEAEEVISNKSQKSFHS